MKILFATDGSEYAAHAAGVLAQLTPNAPMHLTVLTVTYVPPNVDSESVRPWYPEYRTQEETRIKAHFEQLNALLHRVEGSITMLQTDGNPTHEILETAKEVDADMIVIGARGHTTLGRVLLGSVSDAVANRAECSVLVIRPKLHIHQGEDANSIERILLAFDGSPRANGAVREIGLFRWPENISLEIASIIPQLDPFGQEYVFQTQLEDSSSTLQEQAIELKAAFEKDFQQVEANLRRARHVGECIVNEAKKTGVDIIFLGESGHSLMHALFLGSTAKYVLRHAPCSVCISRSHSRSMLKGNKSDSSRSHHIA